MSWAMLGAAAITVIGGAYAANENKKAADKASKKGEAASAAELQLQRDQFDYYRGKDENQMELGGAWYDWQRAVGEQEDARRFGLNDQNFTNAQDYFSEAMENAGLTYDELTGNAYDAEGRLLGNANDLYSELTGNADQYGGMVTSNAQGYQGDIVGNADRMYDELTDNARYSDEDYQQASDFASANVLQSFDKARGSARRNMLRYGGDPNSSDFARFENQSALDQALAESGAVNTSRRAMKSEERGRLNDAIMAGLTARAGALESGYGAVDNANRYAGGMKRDAFTTGREGINRATTTGAGLTSSAILAGRSAMGGAIASGRGALTDAIGTNMNTRSTQLGMVDPRIGMPSTAGNVLGTMANTYGDRAAQYGSEAAANSAAASSALASGIGGAAQIYAANAGRNNNSGGGYQEQYDFNDYEY